MIIECPKCKKEHTFQGELYEYIQCPICGYKNINWNEILRQIHRAYLRKKAADIADDIAHSSYSPRPEPPKPKRDSKPERYKNMLECIAFSQDKNENILKAIELLLKYY